MPQPSQCKAPNHPIGAEVTWRFDRELGASELGAKEETPSASSSASRAKVIEIRIARNKCI
jgi:hypothetical protein